MMKTLTWKTRANYRAFLTGQIYRGLLPIALRGVAEGRDKKETLADKVTFTFVTRVRCPAPAGYKKRNAYFVC
jgi:hypothetical protein